MASEYSDEELDAVFNILRHHIGRENAITAGEIGEALGGIDSDDTRSVTRGRITALIIERNVPIGSSSNGYWILASKDEYEATDGHLKGRQIGIQKRRDALADAIDVYGYGLSKMETTSL